MIFPGKDIFLEKIFSWKRIFFHGKGIFPENIIIGNSGHERVNLITFNPLAPNTKMVFGHFQHLKVNPLKPGVLKSTSILHNKYKPREQ